MIATVEQIYPSNYGSDIRNRRTITIMNKKTLSILLGLLLPACIALGQSGENLQPFRNMYAAATAPSNGTSAIQTLTVGAVSAGTFTITFDNKTTASIAWNGTNATLVGNIDTALEALPTIGTGGVTTAAGTIVNGANGTITVTFTGNRSKQPVPTMTTVSTGLTGGTITAATTTPGVTADGRIYPRGTLVVALDTGKWYTNSGTPLNPTWSIITSTP
jgi:hypothetical protein